MALTTKQAVDKIRQDTQTVIREAHKEMGERIVRRTPVDSGFAKGNWNGSTGAPDTTVSQTPDPGGQQTIAKINSAADSANIGDTLYIANGVEYIGVLENGSSTQAPKGMVRVTLEEHDEIIKRIVARL